MIIAVDLVHAPIVLALVVVIVVWAVSSDSQNQAEKKKASIDDPFILFMLNSTGGRMTPKELAIKFDLDAETILKSLKRLRRENLVEGGLEGQHPKEMERTWAITGKGMSFLQEQ